MVKQQLRSLIIWVLTLWFGIYHGKTMNYHTLVCGLHREIKGLTILEHPRDITRMNKDQLLMTITMKINFGWLHINATDFNVMTKTKLIKNNHVTNICQCRNDSDESSFEHKKRKTNDDNHLNINTSINLIIYTNFIFRIMLLSSSIGYIYNQFGDFFLFVKPKAQRRIKIGNYRSLWSFV
jgi:hypothetical protein